MDHPFAKGQVFAAAPTRLPVKPGRLDGNSSVGKPKSMACKRLFFIVAICFSQVLVQSSAQAAPPGKLPDGQPWRGMVTHISDGDTLWIRPEPADNNKRAAVKIRLNGIDAPEVCQPYGEKAKQVLAERLLRKQVLVQPRRLDTYGRLLATVSLEQSPHPVPDVGAWMVERGHAWSQRYKQDAGPYAVHERRARQQHRGLFAHPGAQRPRDFRLEHGSCQP